MEDGSPEIERKKKDPRGRRRAVERGRWRWPSTASERKCAQSWIEFVEEDKGPMIFLR